MIFVLFPLLTMTGCAWNRTAPPIPGVPTGTLKLWVHSNPPSTVSLKGKLIQAPPSQSYPEGRFQWVLFTKSTETSQAGTAWTVAVDDTLLRETNHIEIWSFNNVASELINKESEGPIDYQGGEYTLGN